MTQKYLALVILPVLFFFLPFFAKPQILTTKDNDLGRTYIGIISFINDSFYTHKQIPLWRPDQLMGETFVGNPISSIFYPGNLIFLIKDSHHAAIIYLFLHITLAGISTFFLAKSFNLSKEASIAAAIFYALSFKILVHLEAGHLTMVAAASYIPLAFLSVRNLLKKSKFNWITTGGFALTFMFFTYPTIFYYTVVFLVSYWVYQKFPNFMITKQLPLAFLFTVTFGLSAIVLFPQLEFAPLSTRSSLQLEDVAHPIWNINMLITSLIFPYKILTELNHEAFLYLGFVPTVLAALGFLKLQAKQKIIVIILGSLALLFAAGLSTPIFSLAYDYVPFLKYSRITTRFWFIVALLAALLSAYALQKINRKLLTIFVLAFLIETTFVFTKRFAKIPYLDFNESIYQYLSQDEDFFRVYCTTHCLNPQLASKYHLEILDGENPIQDASFVEFLEKAGNYKWDQFAVIFPPYQVWQVKNPPVPDSLVLGKANVKYVASTYALDDQNLELVGKFENIFMYKNRNYQRRAYFEDDGAEVEIQNYSPNRVHLKFNQEPTVRKLIIADNYFPGWFAYIDGQKHQVLKSDNQSRLVIVPENTSEVELKFQPQSFEFGKIITTSTLIVMFMYFWYKKKYV